MPLGDEDITQLNPGERLARGVAVLPQGRSVFPQLTIDENLRLGAWQLRKDKARLEEAVEAMLDRYPTLRPIRNKPAGALSGGQARLLEFARTLILDPKVLLIDEPSVGLAPVLVDEVAPSSSSTRTCRPPWPSPTTSTPSPTGAITWRGRATSSPASSTASSSNG